MCRSKSVGNLQGNQQRSSQLKRPAIDELTDIATGDVLHHNEMNALFFVEIENGADVGMIERRSQASFSFETFEVRFLGR